MQPWCDLLPELRLLFEAGRRCPQGQVPAAPHPLLPVAERIFTAARDQGLLEAAALVETEVLSRFGWSPSAPQGLSGLVLDRLGAWCSRCGTESVAMSILLCIAAALVLPVPATWILTHMAVISHGVCMVVAQC